MMDQLFFILSKFAWVFLSPTNLIVVSLIFITVLLCMNRVVFARRAAIMLSLLLIPLWGYPISDYLMRPLETRFSVPASLPNEIDGIIVLGGAEEVKLSTSWQSAQVGQGAERILEAAELSRRYPETVVIYTGGSNLVQRADLEVMSFTKTLLLQAGINSQQFVIESRSRNTYENFAYIKPMLAKPNGIYILITSAFHMPRSVGIARQFDVNVVPYPVDYRSSSAQMRYWDFDLFEHLDVLETAWHEWLGLTVYYLSGKTQSWFPKPSQS